MDKSKRTVLMALYGPQFLIPEDFNDFPLSWGTFKIAVSLEEEFRQRVGKPWEVGDELKKIPNNVHYLNK